MCNTASGRGVRDRDESRWFPADSPLEYRDHSIVSGCVKTTAASPKIWETSEFTLRRVSLPLTPCRIGTRPVRTLVATSGRGHLPGSNNIVLTENTNKLPIPEDENPVVGAIGFEQL